MRTRQNETTPKIGVCLVKHEDDMSIAPPAYARDVRASTVGSGALRGLLVRDELVVVRPLLIVGQHDGDAISKGLVFQGDGKSIAALDRPGRTYARPDFLAILVFAHGLAVVEDIGRCV